MLHEKRHVILHRGFHNIETATRHHAGAIEADIETIVHAHYGPPQRQASDAAALVALALFIGTVAILARLCTG